MGESRKWREGVAGVKSALTLSQLIHFLVPFGIGKSHQCDFVSQPREGERNVRGLFDPVVEGGEEKNIFYFVLRIAY